MDMAAQTETGDDRPDRDRLSGWVEVDETLVGGIEDGAAGRQTVRKARLSSPPKPMERVLAGSGCR